ncbi:hypothetical protein SDC9_93512 [bioreactor metagenome]|uniref:YhfC family intramembrane metalloprotease n=1 Tax=bioreactor metagenome TaxID=1076179 RepID=A0A645A0T5_9ZZZZ
MYTVQTLSIVFMGISALTGFIIPAVLFIVFWKKYQADIAPFFYGCAVFIIFALVLESYVHRLIFASDAGKAILGNVWFYALYGGVMAGIFEETGRYAAFKTVLKSKRSNNANAFMYGAGHGGFEAAYLLGVTMVSNIAMSLTINSGSADKLTAGVTDPAALQRITATITALVQTPPSTFLFGAAERFFAVALHVSCSVLVWFAAKYGGKRFWLYPLAIAMHTFMNAAAVTLSSYTQNLWVLEGVNCLIAAGCIFIARSIWKKVTAHEVKENIEVYS